MRAFLVFVCCVTAALTLPPASGAHVTLEPNYVDGRQASTLTLVVPNERAASSTTGLLLELPVGIEVVSAPATPPWQVRSGRGIVRWWGGNVSGENVARFGVTLRALVRAGTYTVNVRQIYGDGATVSWAPTLTVLPAAGEAAPSEQPRRALVAALIGSAVVAVGLLALHALRRRRG